MGVIKCNVFEIKYKENRYDICERNILVLADSIEEALDIFREKYPKYEIEGIHTYLSIIRRTTKTITIDV